MAKNVVINGIQYSEVPQVQIPLYGSTGVAEFYDTDDATVTSAAQILASYTAYSKGTKYTGSIQTKTGSDLSASGDTVTVPAGYYASSATKAVASGSASPASTISDTGASISTGTNTLTLSKTVSNTPQVSAGYVSAGTAGNSSVSLTASVTTKAADTITPGTSDIEVAAGTYLTGKLTIEGDSALVGSNIVSTATIFGVTGLATLPTISQDSTTKVLSIA